MECGDVNGDGYDDFLIGADLNNESDTYAGQAYLILGRATEDWEKDCPLSDADASFLGEDEDDNAGIVSGAGDVNGDGHADFLIGASKNDEAHPDDPDAGQAYLVLSDYVPPEMEVAIDIKPGSCPNPLNVGSKGVLPVAILGTEEFDVTRIAPESVFLEGVAPTRWSLEDVAAPYEPFIGKEDCMDCTEEGPDGYPDLTLTFSRQSVVATLEEPVEDRECRVLTLTGTLTEDAGGTQIVGEDVIRIQVGGKGKGKKKPAIPAEFALIGNTPNPFNPETTIEYALPEEAYVRLTIYNVMGQTVRMVVDASRPAGYHQIIWDSQDDRGRLVSGGVYLYRMTADGFSETKRMILLR